MDDITRDQRHDDYVIETLLTFLDLLRDKYNVIFKSPIEVFSHCWDRTQSKVSLRRWQQNKNKGVETPFLFLFWMIMVYFSRTCNYSLLLWESSSLESENLEWN
jgi:hypothetical protein